MKFAAAEKLALVPCGARTKLSMGLPPRQYDLALDLIRLDRIAAYDPGDLTLAVEPGVPLRSLAARARRAQAVAPARGSIFRASATVGGAIASGVDTPLRQMYGTARDYVLGMEFVTGEGVAAKSGGRVVKNVTGYDMHKLMIGALGTLGVITKINFRTFPVPLGTRVFIANFDIAAACARIAPSHCALPAYAHVARNSEPMRRLASRDQRSGSHSHARSASGRSCFPVQHWALVAEFSGNEQVLARCERDFRALAGECAAKHLGALAGGEALATTSRVREFIPIALASSPSATIMKITVLPTRMREASHRSRQSRRNKLRLLGPRWRAASA